MSRKVCFLASAFGLSILVGACAPATETPTTAPPVTTPAPITPEVVPPATTPAPTTPEAVPPATTPEATPPQTPTTP
ncbi:hypothetical protein Nos7524_1673 [Nostoc sp. PCC 7524]|uniref:hypothetical protein n=1 Tax=Nostoc sp. (strain ATCC 29411 / PCC 7524) TaxID=28072 RepID=UPI00029EFF62|nr:hypothetical protein [Nostoc sp. PCC 7524]AFY47545.1 hypothetical protein Nos7524_1673 [Nostoc sp. PCC 7524]